MKPGRVILQLFVHQIMQSSLSMGHYFGDVSAFSKVSFSEKYVSAKLKKKKQKKKKIKERKKKETKKMLVWCEKNCCIESNFNFKCEVFSKCVIKKKVV